MSWVCRLTICLSWVCRSTIWLSRVSRPTIWLAWVCRSTIWLAMVDNLIGNGLPVDNLIGDGLLVDNLCFKVAFFKFESLSRSTRQTKLYNGNKADKSNRYSTWRFTVGFRPVSWEQKDLVLVFSSLKLKAKICLRVWGGWFYNNFLKSL